jgi:hypothetical protein
MKDIMDNRFFIDSQMSSDENNYYLLIKERYNDNVPHVKQLKKEVAELKRGIKILIGEPTHQSIAMQLVNDLLKKHLEYKQEAFLNEERLEYITNHEKILRIQGEAENDLSDVIEVEEIYNEEDNMATLKRLMPTFNIELEREHRSNLKKT